MNDAPMCVIDPKKTYKKSIDQKIIVYLDSLSVPLDNLGYLVSPSIMKMRPFKQAPKIEIAYLRTNLYEIWFPYLPFYRFSPERIALVIKAERLIPQNTTVEQFAELLNEVYSEKYLIRYNPSRIPTNMLFCKCTNPPEEEQAILERKDFAEKILQRFFKVSDATADKLDNIMLVVDNYLEAFHTQHLPIIYYTLSGAAGDLELITAMLSAVAGVPEALGLETLATKGDIVRASKKLQERQARLKDLLIPHSEDKDALIRALQNENTQLKRFVQEVRQKMKMGGSEQGATTTTPG